MSDILFVWWCIKAWCLLAGVAVLISCYALYRAWRTGHDS